MSTFSELRSGYGMFLTPAFKIEADGAALSPGELGISGLTVDLALGRTAGACRFTAENIFEEERKLSSGKLGSLKAGTQIKIHLGYGSSLSPVFLGYIASVGLRYSESASVTVSCLDARGLMREGRSDVSCAGKTVTAVAEDILGAYGSLIASKDVALGELIENANVTRDTDDLSFVCGEAEKRGIDFILDVGKASVKAEKPAVCVTLDWEDYELSLDLCYLNTKYTLRAYDREEQEIHAQTGNAAQPGNQSGAVLVNREERADLSISPGSLGTLLNAKTKRDVRDSVKGTLTLAGLPEIKPGSLVKLTNSPLGTLGLGDEFIILTVRHGIDAEGFTTSFTIGGAG